MLSFALTACGGTSIADGDEVATIVAATLGVSDAIPDSPAPAAEPTAVLNSNYIFCEFCGGVFIWQVSSGEPVLVPGPNRFESFYDFSPISGKFLIASEFPHSGPSRKAVSDLQLLDISNGQLTTIVPENVVSAVFAPDGETFAYLLATTSTHELHLRSPDGNDRILATDANLDFAFSQAGNQIAFNRDFDGGEMDTSLHVINLASGGESHIADIDRSGGGSIYDNFHWSPDDSEFWLPYTGQAFRGNALVNLADGTVNQIQYAPDLFGETDNYTEREFVLWDLNEGQLIGWACQCGIAASFTSDLPPGPSHVVLFQLDSSHTTVTSATLLHEFPSDGEIPSPIPLIYWDVPGESLWAILPLFDDGDEIPPVVHIDMP